MNDPSVRAVVVAHGSMAAGLVDAVRQITGVDADLVVALSNRGLSPEALAAEVRARIHGPTIVFTDLQSGSCGFAVRRYCHDLPDLVVMSGVNLPILLEFVMLRELPLAELVPKLISKGRSAISSSKFNAEAHEHRAVSGG
jgi:mannose/fructose-specific phosphotransferase system component IIA